MRVNIDMRSRSPHFIPSVKEYVSAFRSVEYQITAKQKVMLETHYGWYCRVITATDLALQVGFAGPGGAKLQYGKLGSMVSEALGLGSLGVITLALMVPPHKAGNPEWLWVMRGNVARALEQLGWVVDTSNLFYPTGKVGDSKYF